MSLIQWRDNETLDPVREMERLQDEVNRLFHLNRFDSGIGLFDRAESPAIDLIEKEDEFVVKCDLPGVELKDLEVSAAANVLTVKGEKKATRETNGKVYRKETWEGNFQRTVSLPASIDTSRIEAHLKDGTLVVTVPKREEEKPKQISVKIM